MMYQDIFTVPAELRLFIIEKQGRRTFMTYKVTIEVDQQWLDILGQISKHQDGFIWIGVDNVELD
jgi:hypothetical protein